jgi:hypothetical protein
VYGDRFKLISSQVNGEELYDLASDPGEEVNVIERQPEEAQRLRRLLTQYRGTFRASIGKASDEQDRAALRALGYVR